MYFSNNFFLVKLIPPVLLICIFFNFGCQPGEPKRIALQKRSDLVKNISFSQSVKYFELDSITGPKIQCLQYVRLKNQDYLAFLNEETGVLYLNNYQTGKIFSRVVIKDSKPEHRKFFQGFFYQNPDSIFLFYFGPSVALVNNKGEIKKRYNLSNKTAHTPIEQLIVKGFYSSTSNQGFYEQDTLYLNSVVLGGSKMERKKVQILINVKDGKQSFREMDMPPVYRRHNLANGDFHLYSTSYNPKTRKIVYSFPADENLILRNLHDSKQSSFFSGSKYIDFINEYDEKKYRNDISDPMIEHFMTSGSFGSVLFDKFNNLYYRIGFLPVGKKNVNYEEKGAPLKQLCIIVLDQNFKYLGEVKLPADQFQMSSAFVSEKGLNLQQQPLDDELLKFTVFKFNTLTIK